MKRVETAVVYVRGVDPEGSAGAYDLADRARERICDEYGAEPWGIRFERNAYLEPTGRKQLVYFSARIAT